MSERTHGLLATVDRQFSAIKRKSMSSSLLRSCCYCFFSTVLFCCCGGRRVCRTIVIRRHDDGWTFGGANLWRCRWRDHLTILGRRDLGKNISHSLIFILQVFNGLFNGSNERLLAIACHLGVHSITFASEQKRRLKESEIGSRK